MAKDQIYKGSLSAIILKLLKDQGRMYGYEITRRVALYPLLHKLEAGGLLETELVTVGNRSRKYYFLTEKGQRETTEKIREMHDYLVNMQLLFQPVLNQNT